MALIPSIAKKTLGLEEPEESIVVGVVVMMVAVVALLEPEEPKFAEIVLPFNG